MIRRPGPLLWCDLMIHESLCLLTISTQPLARGMFRQSPTTVALFLFPVTDGQSGCTRFATLPVGNDIKCHPSPRFNHPQAFVTQQQEADGSTCGWGEDLMPPTKHVCFTGVRFYLFVPTQFNDVEKFKPIMIIVGVNWNQDQTFNITAHRSMSWLEQTFQLHWLFLRISQSRFKCTTRQQKLSLTCAGILP